MHSEGPWNVYEGDETVQRPATAMPKPESKGTDELGRDVIDVLTCSFISIDLVTLGHTGQMLSGTIVGGPCCAEGVKGAHGDEEPEALGSISEC